MIRCINFILPSKYRLIVLSLSQYALTVARYTSFFMQDFATLQYGPLRALLSASLSCNCKNLPSLPLFPSSRSLTPSFSPVQLFSLHFASSHSTDFQSSKCVFYFQTQSNSTYWSRFLPGLSLNLFITQLFMNASLMKSMVLSNSFNGGWQQNCCLSNFPTIFLKTPILYFQEKMF